MRWHDARLWRRIGVVLGAAALLALVFAAYRDPHLMVDLANRLWACF
jgi:anti-sigma-K factor RskA